ncbi:Nucleic acid binding protein [Dorcoceras hygrometricum]|uniref:Nucleic acid binding protein n=1 Tax=Dorcoceras hygrometricum TaxID=472368 RepID=A0A2Z7B2A2_9LAMI|nr:Nucleic acid binding protein [Dorcoceras hygrometricum]
MQIQQETAMVAEDCNDAMKGKRGKRSRSSGSPLALTMATSSSSTANIGSEGGGQSTGSSVLSDISASSDHYLTLTSREFKHRQEEEEEEDMANCLILLAKGRRQVSSPRFPAAANKGTVAAGDAELYRCKTCNKSFSSFQALGGHRASHKKPMIKPLTTTVEDQNPLAEIKEERVGRTILSFKIRSRSLAMCGGTLNKSRVHQCSICGAEFASGQALGGHMRRHRPLPPSENSSHSESREEKKPGKMLLLDLNLPAPEELVYVSVSSKSRRGKSSFRKTKLPEKCALVAAIVPKIQRRQITKCSTTPCNGSEQKKLSNFLRMRREI